MCTLTYFLTDDGYQLFFNRDEQRSRAIAIAPDYDQKLKAIYPVDPVGGGTWIAVHSSGLSIALLNNYQSQFKQQDSANQYKSRGAIILHLLAVNDDPLSVLQEMDLSSYLAFQLCIFPKHLSRNNKKVHCLLWDGKTLKQVKMEALVTSSAVDFELVSESRKALFKQLVVPNVVDAQTYINYHLSQQHDAKLSVKMSREDAQTVSFTHIKVAGQVEYYYHDYLLEEQHLVTQPRTR